MPRGGGSYRSGPSRRSAGSYSGARRSGGYSGPYYGRGRTPPARRPGLFKQWAATAAGVTLGSHVGAAIGESLTGSRDHYEPPPRRNQVEQDPPCMYEFEKFMNCTQSQADLSLCEGFNEALKNCKRKHNIP